MLVLLMLMPATEFDTPTLKFADCCRWHHPEKLWIWPKACHPYGSRLEEGMGQDCRPVVRQGIERLFSAAGIIHGDTRKSTSEEKIETLLFVKQNCDAAVIKS